MLREWIKPVGVVNVYDRHDRNLGEGSKESKRVFQFFFVSTFSIPRLKRELHFLQISDLISKLLL